MFLVIFPLLLIAGYLVGSIPFGLILTKFFGAGDVREIGSGNIGATNVLRTGNKGLALLTLILDAGKGAFLILILPVYFGNMLELGFGLGAVIGHCFPVWLKFKGGKGVATALGVFLTAVPWAGFVAVCVWGIVAGLFRYSSLAALGAMAVVPLAAFLIYGVESAVMTVLIALLVFWRHKDNIKRLLAGAEPKIGQK